MDAHIITWMEKIKAASHIKPTPAPETERPLAPLIQRLQKFIAGLPPEQRTQPQSLEFFRVSLKGRQGRQAQAGELGDILRKLGYTRLRGWRDGGFKATWHAPK